MPNLGDTLTTSPSGVVMIRVFPLLAALFLLVSPAFADWQYTKWGMTLHEVINASGNRVVPIPEAEQPGRSPVLETARLTGSFTSGRFVFDVDFSFDNVTNKLSTVTLELRGLSQCQLLEQSLRTKYGKPSEVKDYSAIRMVHWRDEKQGNQINYNFVDDLPCQVYYLPLTHSDHENL